MNIKKHLLYPYRRYKGLRGKTVQPVPIFHIGRCGSTVLTSLLNQHPRILADGEIYQMVYPKVLKTRPRMAPRRFTQFQIERKSRSAPLFGRYTYEIKFFSDLDMKHFPAGIPGYTRFLRELGVKQAIVLERRNLLRRFVSTRIAVARGAYQAKDGGSPTDLPSVVLDPDSIGLGKPHEMIELFEKVTQQYDELRSVLQDHGIETLSVTYEDDIESDPLVAAQKCYDFMKLRPFSPTITHHRINTEPLRGKVSNFAQIEDRLRNTHYEWMLKT